MLWESRSHISISSLLDSSSPLLHFILNVFPQRDPTLAKQLFSSLFAGVLQEMDGLEKSNEEKKRIKEELLRDINGFLSKSTLYFPPFVACVQV